jgi:DNA polymerase-3 subunit delta'
MSFRAMSGHRRLLTLIARSIKRDALPPSLLFEGPPGVGKRTAALAVAMAVNCLEPLTDGEFEWDACGECSSCKKMLKDLHPDVRIIEPGETGNIKVEQVREVIDAAAYRPFEGKRRVVIIDRAEQLGEPAQNALLKTLEEPRPASIFILVSSRPDLLLPTVRSRCSRLRFGRSTRS